MNQQVKEMWEKATVSVWPRPGKFTAGEYDYHLEKFAELIVRKCTDLVADDDNAFDILKHFGLEK